MPIDPALESTFPVQTPPIVAHRTQGMVISLMNINQMRYMAFEAFSPSNVAIPCGVFLTGTTDAMGKTILTQPTAPGSNILGASIWNQQRFLNWNAVNGYYEYQPNDLVSLLEEGDIVMYSEVAVDVGQPVYNRIAVNGALTRIGGLSNAAGTGLELVPRARFLEKSAPGLVRVHVDI